MFPPANPSTRLARELLEELAAAGVRELVLSPGSRNAPLAFAAWEADQAGWLRLHTRIDERSAGFLALGLSKVGSRAAVICTSGTAVANLHPAVLEAAHSGVGLIVASADRPARLRGTGASQTTDQVGIFGAQVPCFDIADGVDRVELRAALAQPDQPVHVNVQFDLPLVPDAPWADRIAPEPVAVAPVGEATVTELAPGPRTVVVAGDDAGKAARQLAEAANWPLLAEPSSGSRTGRNAIRSYRLLLGGELGARIQRVVVAGHPTLSRPVTQLLERADVEVVALPSRGIWGKRPFAVDVEVETVRVEAEEPSWLEDWRRADGALSQRVDALLAGESELTPYRVAASVSAAVPPGGLLILGASSPVRDLDLMARPYPVGQRRRVIANRGLAGIDGTISTAIGAAWGRSHGGRNFALLGDVTFLHDTNGLVLGPDEPRPDLTIVVVNDDGGSIFTMLEQGAPTFDDRFEKLFGTPHGVDLAALCASTRTPHWRVESAAELEQALNSPNGGIEVIEVRVRRDNRRELDARLGALVTDA
ncbi:2-succinyl-5-enolpyruvyl-6-hydroxy-3-cyclohexene-1-carboxylic-acid synthase [Nocardioides sp. Bht2]|uniref:2-succinyl-5-enolpyruvyl-6-hydroxy-3- cyclohexene-1-carboxylic-acid synthase n=1 Tax=Nocardioides sp. Bht2 TaxID=3392297 RepID=UPI0039B391C9